jgi:hypothetical protein
MNLWKLWIALTLLTLRARASSSSDPKAPGGDPVLLRGREPHRGAQASDAGIASGMDGPPLQPMRGRAASTVRSGQMGFIDDGATGLA